MTYEKDRVAVRSGSRAARASYTALCLAIALVAGCMGGGSSEPTEDEAGEAVEVGADDGLAPPTKIDKGGADLTCIGFWATGTGPLGGPNSVLGQCLSRDNSWVQSVAWLPGCMGNNNGTLVWGGRYFDRSCRDCRVTQNWPWGGAWFECSCRRVDNSFVHTSIKVSDYLTNRNGVLTCD